MRLLCFWHAVIWFLLLGGLLAPPSRIQAESQEDGRLSLRIRAIRHEARAGLLTREEKPFSAAREMMAADRLWERYYLLQRAGRETSSPTIFASQAVTRAELLLTLGLPAAAEAQLKQVRRSGAIPRARGSLFSRTLIQSRIHVAQHQFEEALKAVESAERLLRGSTLPYEREVMITLQLETLLAMGRSSEALALFQAYGRPSPGYHWEALVPLAARAHVQRGERVQALALLDRYQADIERSSLKAARLEASLLRTELLLELRQSTESSRWIERSRTLLADVETPEWQLRFAVLAAHFEALEGRSERALETLRSASAALKQVTERQEKDGSLAELLMPLSGTVVSSHTVQRPLEAYAIQLAIEQSDLLARLGRWKEAEEAISPYLTPDYSLRPGESTLRILVRALEVSIQTSSGAGRDRESARLIQARAEAVKDWLSRNVASDLRRMAALEQLARALLTRGQKQDAVAQLEQAAALELREVLHTPGSPLERALRAETFGRVREQLFALLVDAGRWADALALQESARGHLTGDVGTIASSLHITAEERESLDRLAAEQGHLARVLEHASGMRGSELVPRSKSGAAAHDASSPEVLLERWQACTREREGLLAGIRSRQLPDGTTAVFAALRAHQIQAAADPSHLRRGELVLGWTVGASSVWVWAMSTQGIQGGLLSLTPGEIETEVAALRASLDPSAPAEVGVLRTRLTSLWQRLTRPVAKSLASVTRIMVVPEGVLEQLPFAAIPHGDQGWLGTEMPLSQSTSLTRLFSSPRPGEPTMAARGTPAKTGAPSATASQRAPSVLVVADSLLGKGSLPHAAREGEAVAGLYGTDAILLLQGQASEARVWEGLARAEIAVFATHAVSVPFEPRESYLRLAVQTGAAEVAEAEAEAAAEAAAAALSPRLRSSGGQRTTRTLDGRLTAGELIERPLPTRLVVLSGCSTGETAAVPRPGDKGGTPADPARPSGTVTLGLAQAFVASGVEQVMASLWPVADQAASLNTRTFLTAMRNGTSAAEAQRQARQVLMEAELPLSASSSAPPVRSSHPAYWAPFFLIERWDGPALPSNRESGVASASTIARETTGAPTPPESRAPGKKSPDSSPSGPVRQAGSPLPQEAGKAPGSLSYPKIAYTPQGIATGGLGFGAGQASAGGAVWNFTVRLEAQYGLLHAGLGLARFYDLPPTDSGGTGSTSSSTRAVGTTDLSLGAGHAWGKFNPSLELVLRRREWPVGGFFGGDADLGLGLGLTRWLGEGVGIVGRLNLFPGGFGSGGSSEEPGVLSPVQLELGATIAVRSYGTYRPLSAVPSPLRALLLAHGGGGTERWSWQTR